MQGDIEESAQPVFGSTKSTAQTERFKNFSWKYNLWLILTRSKMKPNSPQLGCREQQIHSFVYPRGGIRWGKVQQRGAEAWPSCWDQHLWSCRGSPGSARSLLPLLGSHRYLKTKASLFFSCIFRKKKKKSACKHTTQFGYFKTGHNYHIVHLARYAKKHAPASGYKKRLIVWSKIKWKKKQV